MIQYHFNIMWNLLSCLPPSVEFLWLLESNTIQMSNAYVLHSLRWAQRLGHKVYIGWIKVRSHVVTRKFCPFFLFFFFKEENHQIHDNLNEIFENAFISTIICQVNKESSLHIRKNTFRPSQFSYKGQNIQK
jgi:hypothetical protein